MKAQYEHEKLKQASSKGIGALLTKICDNNQD